MSKYNTKFELSVDDMALIETALRGTLETKGEAELCPRDVNDLLGRLHNQKVFYRPTEGYVGG